MMHQTYLQKLLIEANFSNEEIEKIEQIIESVCHHCWDAPNGCQCWNDE